MSKIGFIFSTKDRVEFSKKTLKGIDVPGSNFDLIWVDGSDTKEGRLLPERTKFQHCNLAEVYYGMNAEYDKAPLSFGFKYLVQHNYDYCGFIENDIRFEKNWFIELMKLFNLGKGDGLEVGAATAKVWASRVLRYEHNYVTIWNLGAAMVLFTAKAAKIIYNNLYHGDKPRYIYARELQDFYLNKFDINIRHNSWELLMGTQNRYLSRDWGYAMELNKHELSSLGTIPSLAFDMEYNVEKRWRTHYVKTERVNK